MKQFAAIEIYLLAGWLSVLSSSTDCPAEDNWGDLTLRIVYDGTQPKTRLIENDVDAEICGAMIRDESLVVNDKDRGIANVAIWLVPPKGQKVPEHPSLTTTNDGPTINVKNCRYEPRIVLMRPPGVLRFWNMDPTGINPVTPFVERENAPTSSNIPARRTIRVDVHVEEYEPVGIGCNIHPWMKTWLIALDTPYMAVSDTSGKITIKNLPAGKWVFRMWHERAKFIKGGTLDGEAVEWPRGRIEREIKAGKNELGEMKLKPEVFR